mmetsp:Transcript_4075/g.6029  ORF Transcript_4075/g.6029 Transcript_4075/m.6029 type:complete len:365 (-) Transcript_4075:34-1128(-)
MSFWKVEIDEKASGKWDISTPEFKSCKARIDKYNSNFNTTWFKAPYKYYIRMRISGVNEEVKNMIIKAKLVFEDTTKVPIPEKHPEAITNAIAEFEPNCHLNSTYEAIIGPFQYNVCSYKMAGRKFRIQLIIGKSTTKDYKLVEDGKRRKKVPELVMGMNSTMMVSPIYSSKKKLNTNTNITYASMNDDIRSEIMKNEKMVSFVRITSPPLIIRAKKKHTPENQIISRKRKEEFEPPHPQKQKKIKKKESPINVETIVSYFQQGNSSERQLILNGILGSIYPYELIQVNQQILSLNYSTNLPITRKIENYFQTSTTTTMPSMPMNTNLIQRVPEHDTNYTTSFEKPINTSSNFDLDLNLFNINQ